VVPFALTLGLFIGLLLFLSLGSGGEARAEQSAPHGAQPSALGAQGTLTNTRPSNTRPITGSLLTPVQAQPVITPPLTVTAPLTATGTLTEAIIEALTTALTGTITPTPAEQLPVVPLQPDEVLTGTIVLNRTEKPIFFFLENDLYELPANRATGLALVRPLAGLTLFDCAADVEDVICAWVAYPIRRSAFYEINVDPSAVAPANLRLGLATPPDLETAWIQNRTGADAEMIWGETLLGIPNTGVTVLQTDTLSQIPLYLPHCLQSSSQRICEWLPIPLRGGIYYALRQTPRPAAGISNVTLARSELEPLLIQEALMTPTVTPTPTPTPEPAPEGIFCQTQIPSLNVRSGPSTNFSVIGRLRTDEANRGRVLVVGRTANGAWLNVDPSFVPGGWVASAPQWILCDGAIDALPVMAEEEPVRAISTPVPAPAAGGQPAPLPQAAETPTATPEPDPQSAGGLGPEQALLIATNSFDYPIRFTLDAALHGLPIGTPSEYDLEPRQSIQFVIRAGRVQFSASTAWRDGSGNAEFPLAEGASRELFLRFQPAENDPNRWELRFE